VYSETGEVVSREDIARGYEVGKGQYLVVEDEEFEAIQIESTRTIDIDQFVPRSEIGILSDLTVGHDVVRRIDIALVARASGDSPATQMAGILLSASQRLRNDSGIHSDMKRKRPR
jgi:hypothetical protein